MYHAVMIVVSLAIYAGIAVVAVSDTNAAGGVLAYAAMIGLGLLFVRGMFIGSLRGNAIRVSERQFPRLHEQVKQHAAAIGLPQMPDVFVLQSGGAMNAFATRFFSRDFVVIYSDVLALAEQRGEAAVGFIVAHELAHVARGHLKHRWLTLPARSVPYLGAAWSRACEYTCDRFGAHCQPDGALDGLLALASGPMLYRQVDAKVFAEQAHTEAGFWTRRAELMSSHPHLTKRVGAILSTAVKAPAYSPMRERSAVPVSV